MENIWKKWLKTWILIYFGAQNDPEIGPLRPIFNKPLKVWGGVRRNDQTACSLTGDHRTTNDAWKSSLHKHCYGLPWRCIVASWRQLLWHHDGDVLEVGSVALVVTKRLAELWSINQSIKSIFVKGAGAHPQNAPCRRRSNALRSAPVRQGRLLLTVLNRWSPQHSIVSACLR